MTHSQKEGSDCIKVLFDPDNLLDNYKVIQVQTEKSELVENLNSIIYTAVLTFSF